MNKHYPIRMVDINNTMIMDRKGIKEFWWPLDPLTDRFARLSLRLDAQEHNVRLLQYDVTERGVTALVEPLSPSTL